MLLALREVRQDFLQPGAMIRVEAGLDDRGAICFWRQRNTGASVLAAERFGWGRPLPEGRAAGSACELSFGSYVAHTVELSLDGSAGRVTVHRAVAAVDCALAVKPLAVLPAVTNALRRLTGERHTTLPLTPERLKTVS